jgi:hypothetical protein
MLAANAEAVVTASTGRRRLHLRFFSVHDNRSNAVIYRSQHNRDKRRRSGRPDINQLFSETMIQNRAQVMAVTTTATTTGAAAQ